MGVVLLLSAGCAGEPAPTSLEVSFDAGDGTEVQRATLRCDPPGATGFLAGREEGLCADMEGALEELVAGIDPGTACTQLYGGPQLARVRGTAGGEDLDVTLSRTDGCEIDRWSRFGALVEPDTGELGTPGALDGVPAP